MTIFLILAPYGVFTSLMLVTSAAVSVFTAATVCLAVIALDAYRGRSLKILGVGGAILFAGIGCYILLIAPALAAAKVRLAVDVGIFVISLGSILMRYPFTLQYALESVPAEIAAMPGFVRANYIIAASWTLASLLMMLANAALVYVPGLPIWSSVLVAFAARNSAVYFTKWYPRHQTMKYARPHADALPSVH
jgi:hypothetical protein